MSDTESESAPDIEAGRYLYCVVSLDEEEDPSAFDAEGVDSVAVRVVAFAGLGAVVHDTDALYDSEDPQQVQSWLLDHQSVVDAAGERFGTPLPVRFDTVLRGGDEGVRSWLEDHRDTLERHLGRFAGCWEYRIEVLVDPETLRAGLAEDDEQLRELAEKRERVGEGTAFMVDKQYENRLREVKRTAREARTSSLESRLTDLADEVERLGSRTTALGVEREDRETQARLTVLAPESNEAAIGEVLDDVAAETGVEVRFTGPWPPYSFAPSFDDGTE
ncbi:gas vesicle protein GvpL [Halomarina litorea]|uniref:gas vesicle protein GvpL n=1 Tax=Halomarina litorea TaxID=2961595 RepID=UPI0020C22FAC|nr:GvpL/GvpF family gas vesicle protein [Halomarina sp. BCD28]